MRIILMSIESPFSEHCDQLEDSSLCTELKFRWWIPNWRKCCALTCERITCAFAPLLPQKLLPRAFNTDPKRTNRSHPVAKFLLHTKLVSGETGQIRQRQTIKNPEGHSGFFTID